MIEKQLNEWMDFIFFFPPKAFLPKTSFEKGSQGINSTSVNVIERRMEEKREKKSSITQ